MKSGVVIDNLPPSMEVRDLAPLTLEAILDTRDNHCNGALFPEWLILWKSQPVEEATWESATAIQTKYPSFYLKDKANFREGGNDGIQPKEK